MTITGIQQLHHYIFQQAVYALSSQYKGQTNTFAMDSKTAELGVAQIMKIIDNQPIDYKKVVEWKNSLLDKYYNYALPLSSLSQLLNVPIIALWYSLTADQDIGITACGLPSPETQIDDKILSEEKVGPFCVDITAILALFNTGIAEDVTSSIGKFKVAQSTVDLIGQMVKNRDSVFGQTNWMINIPTTDGKTVRHKISQERYQQLWNDLEKINLWVQDYCNPPEPATTRLSIPQKDQEMIVNVIGETLYDTLLLSKEKGYTIITDDFQFHLYCTGDDTKAICTFSLFKYLRINSRSLQQKDKFNEAICKLLKLNYRFIDPDTRLIIYASKQDDSFKLILNYLYLDRIKPNAILNIGFNFIRILWMENISEGLLKKRSHEVLDALSKRVSPDQVYEYLTDKSVEMNEKKVAFENYLADWKKS